MDNLTVPKRYDWVSFDYKGEHFIGEVRRVEDKPKGKLMTVVIDKNQYRSCYLEQCENLVYIGDNK